MSCPALQYSGGQPLAAICGRADLSHKAAIPKGCYDAKVTSASMARQLESEVVNGPTTQAGPPFRWVQLCKHRSPSIWLQWADVGGCCGFLWCCWTVHYSIICRRLSVCRNAIHALQMSTHMHVSAVACCVGVWHLLYVARH